MKYIYCIAMNSTSNYLFVCMLLGYARYFTVKSVKLFVIGNILNLTIYNCEV